MGRKAHITLATAQNVKPVNAGIDLLHIVQAEKEQSTVTYQIKIPDSENVLRCYKHGYSGYKKYLWAVYPKKAISVEAIFTGYYV